MYLGHCFKSATVAGAGVCVEFQQFVSVESALVLFFCNASGNRSRSYVDC